jgi:hypothetical protein
MNSTIEMKLQKIERISKFLHGLCTSLRALVVILAVLAIVAMFAGRVTSINYFYQSYELAGLGTGSRLILAVFIAAAAAVMLKALYHLRRLLGNYSRREIFTAGSARQIRQFGISCILWGVVKIAWELLPLLLSTNPSHLFTVTPDPIVIGAVVIGISWFTEMAATLREENELTI